jgi:hypothetical protein
MVDHENLETLAKDGFSGVRASYPSVMPSGIITAPREAISKPIE